MLLFSDFVFNWRGELSGLELNLELTAWYAYIHNHANYCKLLQAAPKNRLLEFFTRLKRKYSIHSLMKCI